MPWSAGADRDRKRMIEGYLSGKTREQLATEFGLSLRCVAKWIARFKKEGWDGLNERSRRPLSSPNRTPVALVKKLIRLKRKHPKYGPMTLIEMFGGAERPMAGSTAGDILKRHGMVRPHKNRRRVYPSAPGPIVIPSAGHTMTADYKGQFPLGNGKPCYALTLMEPVSRYLLACDAFSSTATRPTRAAFERVFRDVGIPNQIITDNGVPFCAAGSIGGLTVLSVWWLKLQITHTRIQPGKPQQNGRHERFHRTLKEFTTEPRERTMVAQQRRFDKFAWEYNQIRPHRALNGKRPGNIFQPYSRSYPLREPTIEYPENTELRHVRSNGEIQWKGGRVYMGTALINEFVALKQQNEQEWGIYFGTLLLGTWDQRTKRLAPLGKGRNARSSTVIKPLPRRPTG